MDEGWSCDQCTLINPSDTSVCAACGWELPAKRSPATDSLKSDCEQLVSQIWSQNSLTALLMLVGNVADHPCELKYRGPIRKANARINASVVQVPGASEVLSMAGFVEDEESFNLQTLDLDKLAVVRQVLQQQETKVQSMAAATSSSYSSPAKVIPTKKRAFDENVMREIQAEAEYQAVLRGKAPAAASPEIKPSEAPAPASPDDVKSPERPSASRDLRIRLRLPLGGSREMRVPAQTSVCDFQEQVHSLTGVPPIHQRIRYGFPTRVLAASEELSGIAEVGLQDGDVLTLEDLHDLFLGSLESGQFTMEELLNKMPPCEGSEASAETLFLKALAAFHIGMQETDFWGAVMAKVRALVGHEDFKKIAPEDVENVSDGLLALQKLFRHHDTHHRMLLVLRALPLRHKARQHTKLSIDRSRFFSCVADNVMDLDRRQMLTRLSVSYVGEKGVDAGGLTRDFFSSFSSTLVDDPQMKAEPVIWKKTGRGSLHPMPYPVPQTTYGRQPNRMYQVCGRVFAMAMLHGCKMGCPLSRPFVRIMLNSIPDTLPELIAELNHEAGDQKDFRGNKEFLEKSLEELGLAGTLTFTGSTGCELIPGGASIQVTDENKEDWLRRVLKWELFSSAEHAASWFRAGLVDVLGGHREMKSARCPLLCLFDADTLIELWGKSGVTRSQVAIWRAVSDISRRVEQQAAWFFQVLEQDFDDELRGKVLQFTTGSSSMGREGLQIFRIDVAEGSDGRLPSAMTCGNLLQLPRYSSKVVLRRQLQTAVETTGSFEML